MFGLALVASFFLLISTPSLQKELQVLEKCIREIKRQLSTSVFLEQRHQSLAENPVSTKATGKELLSPNEQLEEAILTHRSHFNSLTPFPCYELTGCAQEAAERDQEQLGRMTFDLGNPLDSHGLEKTAFGQQGPIILIHPFLWSKDMFSAGLSTMLMSTPPSIQSLFPCCHRI